MTILNKLDEELELLNKKFDILTEDYLELKKMFIDLANQLSERFKQQDSE